ncbi:hypothetical protein [Natronobeatus ordinarius]|nr:hypothetical protein [Natronobeatus ordinarius]
MATTLAGVMLRQSTVDDARLEAVQSELETLLEAQVLLESTAHG